MTDITSPLVFAQAPEAPETFNVLLYGQPKSGKSTAAATSPGPILWVNAEGPGALGFARKTAAGRGTQILEVVVDKKARNVAAILDEVYVHVRDGMDPKPRTVVVDTVGKIRDALVALLVVPGSKNSLQQYGQVNEKLGGFLTAMRDLPVNLILLAHVETLDDAETGRIVQPLVGGKLTNSVPGEVDVVSYTSALRMGDEEKPRYFGQLVEARGRIAGDRSDGLANEQGIRELDMTEWLSTYRQALTPDTSDLPWGADPAGDEPVDTDAQQTLGGDA